MAIQTINLTVPGGDTPRSANTKLNANFSNQEHAASRLVGTGTGQIPQSQDVFKAAYALDKTPYTGNVDDLAVGTKVFSGSSATNNPAPGSWVVYTITSHYEYGLGELVRRQIAMGYARGNDMRIMTRTKADNASWSAWTTMGQTPDTYSTTTASGANVAVDTNGRLMRSTSSERYKDVLAPLELDDARYADAMALKPIVYRSTANADNPAYHYYSFSAEALGAYDPAFTLWRETETVTDDEGNTTEQALDERQAEGININALLAMGHAIAIKQGELIKDLQDQVIEQKEAIAALQQTNP